MKLMGFNFTKISAEKKTNINKELKINMDINISEIKEIKSDILKTKETVLGIDFKNNINYSPDFAKIEFAGNLIVAVDTKQAKNILKLWKDKKFDEDFRFKIFNIILTKSNIKAFQLEEELNLPLHMPLQTLKKPVKQ